MLISFGVGKSLMKELGLTDAARVSSPVPALAALDWRPKGVTKQQVAQKMDEFFDAALAEIEGSGKL
jgi:hypothetical protein